ncbi:AAC(3) family N-acetyltransferase [Sorangium sp. So ce136]
MRAPQPLSPPHGPDSPPGRVHELGGQVLLLGVTHAESTPGEGCEECDVARASVPAEGAGGRRSGVRE